MLFRSDAAPSLDVAVVAGTKCVAGKALVTVQATNNDDVPISVSFDSSFGTKSFASVAPAKNAVHAFTTRLANVPAASVTAHVTASVDGTPVSLDVEAPYDARSCG